MRTHRLHIIFDGVIPSFGFRGSGEIDGTEAFPTVKDVPEIGAPVAQRHRGTDEGMTNIEEVIFKCNLSLAFDSSDLILL